MAWISNTDGFAHNGQLINEVARMFPKYAFSTGLHPDSRRHCLFVYTHLERHTSFPLQSTQIAAIEVEGSSKEAFNLLVTKLMMVCG